MVVRDKATECGVGLRWSPSRLGSSQNRQMDLKLAQLASLSQKDKGPAYTSLIHHAISQPLPAADLHLLVDAVVNQDSVGLVVARQVLAELVRILGDGSINDTSLRKQLVEDTLATVQPRIVSFEEQVCYSEWRASGLLNLRYR